MPGERGTGSMGCRTGIRGVYACAPQGNKGERQGQEQDQHKSACVHVADYSAGARLSAKGLA